MIQNFEIGPEQRPLFLYTAVYEGLFRIYDGTEKWPGGDTRPKLAQLESSGLEEDVDFERHYAFGKDSKTVITGAYYSVYGKTDSVEDNEYFSKPDDKITGPGYILEYIEGKGAYAGQQVFVLHSIAVPVTVQVDDAYKLKSDDPEDQTPDPLFTATLTVDELPEGVTVAPDILDIGCDLEILKGPQPKDAEPEAGASADSVQLIPYISDKYLEEHMNFNILRKTVNSSGSIYKLIRPWYEGPSESETEDTSSYSLPVLLRLMKGDLIEEDHDPLPASESRVAKQLEAENLVQGQDGKYTTNVKLTLPVTDGVDPKEYYQAHHNERGGYDPIKAEKQNDIILDEAVAMELSSDFTLPADKNGMLDLSKFRFTERFFGNASYPEEPVSFTDWEIENVFGGKKPVKDSSGYWNYYLKGYRVDLSEERDFPEGAEAIGFGLKESMFSQADDAGAGTETGVKAYPKEYFYFWILYLPEGFVGQDVVGSSESGSSMIDPSLFTGPVMILFDMGDDEDEGDWSRLSPLHSISLEFVEELKTVSTTPGTYGSYDQYGKGDSKAIKVLDKAILFRHGERQQTEVDVSAAYEGVEFDTGVERPEEFFIPAVSYTVKENGNGGNGGSGGSGGSSSGGGGGAPADQTTPTTVITEPEVPLAELPVLNKTDHVAYVVGYEDGTVRPENYITRAEVATIFYRLLTDDSRKAIWSGSNSFTDTAAGAWYNNAVSTLSNGGVISGYTDGTFLPAGNITRAEFATIAARFDESVVDTSNVSFTDISGHWAEKNIKRAAALGYITGYQDGSFKPNAPITRAEAMTLMNRVLGRDKITADGLLEGMKTFTDNPASAWYYVAVQEATNSHEYKLDGGVEAWTGIVADRDWAALEKEWAKQ